MDSSIVGLLLLQAALIALNAIFACAEIAVISTNDNKLAKMAAEGDKRALRLQKLTSQPARFLSTIQVAITLSGFLGSAFAAENFSDPLVSWLLSKGLPVPAATLDAIVVVAITIILSYFTLIFGELVPKRLAQQKAEELALGMSGLISTIATLFSPIVWLLTVSTNAVLRLMRIDPDAQDDEMGEEEIRMMVDVGSEKGVIDSQEKEFIQNVFEFDDRTAGEIATHRTDVSILWLDESMDEWAQTIHGCRHTRYPVCDESADNVVGILNAKDYFRLEDRSRENVLREAVRAPYFVPESVKLDVLFRNMKRTHNPIAVVLDEYGGMYGILTLNDLVEQLVGDLGEENPDEQEPQIQSLSEDMWKIQGETPLDEVEKALDVTLPCEEFDTFSGLIFDALGAVPRDGETVELQVGALDIRVTEISEHQVQWAIVKKRPPEAETQAE